MAGSASRIARTASSQRRDRHAAVVVMSLLFTLTGRPRAGAAHAAPALGRPVRVKRRLMTTTAAWRSRRWLLAVLAILLALPAIAGAVQRAPAARAAGPFNYGEALQKAIYFYDVQRSG